MKKVPNILTSIRVILTIVLNVYIVLNFGSILLPLLFTICIFSSDVMDGIVARKFDAATDFGALFDFLADLFYIVISYIVLCWFHILPWAGLVLILFKAVEFIATSLILRAYKPKNQILFFDYLGKTVAMIFYLIPITAYLSSHLTKTHDPYVEITIFCIITTMVLISSFRRIHLCLESRDFKLFE